MYKKNIEIKIVRTRHEVYFGNGTRAIDILDDLKQVPKEARLKEINENGSFSLVFELDETVEITG